MTTHADPDKLPELVHNLRHAAEIEQQFMCMYLYGAFSIRKRYDNGQKLTLTPAHQEVTRRWANTIYSVARQEMEHLAIVNNLLRALGAAPCFARKNLSDRPLADFHLGAEPTPRPVRAAAPPTGGPNCDELVPIPHDFKFDKFDLAAARRWTCMEAANCRTLLENDADHFAHWCFARKTAAAADREAVEPGTIQHLYHRIEKLISGLPATAFVNGADAQVVIEQQYDIYVFPVTDVTSALQAMRLITEQGEGMDAPPAYPSHYNRFYDIVREWECQGADLEAAWDVAADPRADDIVNPCTKRVFHLFNEAYEALLIMLTALYAAPKQAPTGYPYLAPALGMEAFAPYMTMVVRSLAEVLVQLRTDNPAGLPPRVGPGFDISLHLDADLRHPYADRQDGMAGRMLKPMFANIDEINRRVEAFADHLEDLLCCHPDPPVAEPELAGWAKDRMHYILTNARRIATNLRRIYQQNVFSALQTIGY